MKRSIDWSWLIRLVRAAALVAVIAGDALAQGDTTVLAPDLVPMASRMIDGTVTVRNAGSAVAGASIATVVCSRINGGICAQSMMMMTRFANPAYPGAIVVAIPAIAAGDIYNYRLPFWDALEWPNGEFHLTVRADASRSIAESDEGNNETSAIITKP